MCYESVYCNLCACTRDPGPEGPLYGSVFCGKQKADNGNSGHMLHITVDRMTDRCCPQLHLQMVNIEGEFYSAGNDYYVL